MSIYNRKTGLLEEKDEYQEGLLNFLYNTIPGRCCLRVVVSPLFSKVSSLYYKSPLSKSKMDAFIKDFSIDIKYWDVLDFKSFNDFFIRRRIINEFDKNPQHLISPAEGYLSAFKITDDLRFDIKHSNYSLNELVDFRLNTDEYKDGYCLVFRLAVDNYHRHIFVDNGKQKESFKINGKLHTVRPISEKYRVFSRNSREVSLLITENFDEIIQIEVGALLIGAIKNSNKKEFIRGEEKGYFEYGGSTIILLLKNGLILDEDILKAAELGNEIKVNIGEKIGIFKKGV